RDTAAQCFDHEVAYRADVSSQQVEMVEPPHADAAAVIALCDILERRSLGRRRLINTRIVVNLEDMSVGIVEAIGSTVAEIAFDPADAAAHLFDDGDPALKSRLRRS